MMKSLIYYGPGDLRMEEREIPEPGDKDVIIKVKRAGICGSDLTAYLHNGLSVGILKKGEFGHDGQFGHEMAGIVWKTGKDVRGIKEGDRVFVNPTVCKKNGMLGCDIAGAFSEYVLVEEAAYGYNLMKLSDDVSFDEAVVIEPLAVGTHGKNCIHVNAHEHVVIYGAGTIGLCVLNALIASGCCKPVVVDTNEARLKIAEKMGAKAYCSEKNGLIKPFLEKHFGTVVNMFGFRKPDVDAWIDCAGAKPILGQITELGKEGTRISIVAVYKQSVTFDVAEFMSGRFTMQGSCGFDLPDMKEAFQNVNMHRIPAANIITHHFPHEKSIEAFQTAANPGTGAIKVVIDYE